MDSAIAKHNEDAKTIIEQSAPCLGSLAQAVIALVFAHPLGILVGAAMGPIMTQIIVDLAHSRPTRAQQRLGAAAGLAIYRIRQRLERGELIRDSILLQNVGSRPEAAEVLEGCLRSAIEEHQEKKILHYGELFASFSFNDSMSSDRANHFAGIGAALTYRQYKLLALFAGDKVGFRKTDMSGKMPSDISEEEWSVLQEVFDLAQMGLVQCGHTTPIGQSQALLAADDVVPAVMNLTKLGQDFFVHANLRSMQESDLEDTRKWLIGPDCGLVY